LLLIKGQQRVHIWKVWEDCLCFRLQWSWI